MNRFRQTDPIAFGNWRKFLSGDREALGSIFRQYFSDLVAYGTKITGSDDLAKDQIQELFARLWERRSMLGDVKNVRVYLLISLKNDLLSKKRRDCKTEMLNDQNALFAISSEDFIIEREQERELAGKVASSLARLTARQREVIYLRFYMNLDFPQLAEVLDMNIQSVRNLLFRTLEKIRKEVNDSDIQRSENIELILFSLFGYHVTLA
jgi:RNA polymerase sigma factor (sigma-70 family)